MGYIYKQHYCKKPTEGMNVDDVWECDECQTRYQFLFLFGWRLVPNPWPMKCYACGKIVTENEQNPAIRSSIMRTHKLTDCVIIKGTTTKENEKNTNG
jgi:DNA-directed RNA polymerase subunit RPC12/RpoP